MSEVPFEFQENEKKKKEIVPKEKKNKKRREEKKKEMKKIDWLCLFMLIYKATWCQYLVSQERKEKESRLIVL